MAIFPQKYKKLLIQKWFRFSIKKELICCTLAFSDVRFLIG